MWNLHCRYLKGKQSIWKKPKIRLRSRKKREQKKRENNIKKQNIQKNLWNRKEYKPIEQKKKEIEVSKEKRIGFKRPNRTGIQKKEIKVQIEIRKSKLTGEKKPFLGPRCKKIRKGANSNVMSVICHPPIGLTTDCEHPMKA